MSFTKLYAIDTLIKVLNIDKEYAIDTLIKDELYLEYYLDCFISQTVTFKPNIKYKNSDKIKVISSSDKIKVISKED
jgi:hypothetical protein